MVSKNIPTASSSFSSAVWLMSFLCALPMSHAYFASNISSYVNVQLPYHLHVHNTTGGMAHHRAHFGSHFDFFRQHGHMEVATVYANGPFCPFDNNGGHDNSTNHTTELPHTPFFLLADEGDCSPVTKAHRAQAVGAAGLVIVSKHCLCHETDCADEDDDNHCMDELSSLDDNGSGGSISIPTVIITKSDGEHIKSALRKKETVLLEMAWHMPQRESNVTLDYWHTPSDMYSEQFLTNFSTLAMELGDRIEFRPHFHLLNGRELGCVHSVSNDTGCKEMCTNQGKYCSLNHYGIKGESVVEESLRRMCLWQHYPNKKEYWEYLIHFNEYCVPDGHFKNPDCHKDAYKHSKVKEDDIDSCMKDSGSLDTEENTLLEQAIQVSSRVIHTPTLWINGLASHTPLMAKFVFEAMCLGYAPGKAPHACYACATCGDPAACVSRHPMKCEPQDSEIPDPNKSSSRKKHGGWFWKFVLVVFIFGGIGGYVYYKKYMEDGSGVLGGYSLGEALMSDTA